MTPDLSPEFSDFCDPTKEVPDDEGLGLVSVKSQTRTGLDDLPASPVLPSERAS